uniref:Transposase_23 domain-containing protein n=1 Tax=Elaeophora elaphi TaxID=1147741 RepID=A0A0R3RSU6_9BILA
MSSNQHKNFLPETVNLLIYMMNIILDKAEQLSRRNQLPTENPGKYKSFEVTDNKKASSEKALSSVLKSKFTRTDLPVNEAQPTAVHAIGVDVLSTDITSAEKERICYEPIKIEIPKKCPSATFSYMMKARKDAENIHIPAKIVVTQLREAGVDIIFHMDTQEHPELPSLNLCIHCPNYKPKQVWINGNECIH